MTSQSLTSIYYALIYPYLTYGCVLWGNNYEASLSQLVRLQNKAIRIINNVPLREHITPHYVNLGLIKLPDIVKLYTCQLFYDHLIEQKPSKYTLSLVSEQHNYSVRYSKCIPTTLKSWFLQNKYKEILSHCYWTFTI